MRKGLCLGIGASIHVTHMCIEPEVISIRLSPERPHSIHIGGACLQRASLVEGVLNNRKIRAT